MKTSLLNFLPNGMKIALYVGLVLSVILGNTLDGQVVINDICDNAISLSCSSDITGDMIDASNGEDPPICGFDLGDTEGLWYTIEGVGDVITLEVVDSEFFPAYFVYSGECDNLVCVDDDYEPFVESNYSFLGLEGIIYYVFIVSDIEITNESPFTLNTSCRTPESNDSCTNPILLSCDDVITGDLLLATPDQGVPNCDLGILQNTLWYSFTGQGEEVRLEVTNNEYVPIIQVYESDCSSLECIGSGFEDVVFSAEVGVTYSIQISTDFIFEDGTFELALTCSDALPNDNCSGALRIACGANITENISFATTDNDIPICGRGFGPGTGLWYSIIGSGEIISIEVQSEPFTIPLIYGYSGPCDELVCIDDSYDPFDGPSFTFLSEVGVEYRVLVIPRTDESDPSFNLSVTCLPQASNDVCENAVSISCGSIMTGDLREATGDFSTPVCDDILITGNSLWYTLLGEGDLVQINVDAEAFRPVIGVYEQSCVDLVCVSSISDRSRPIVFLAEEGIHYLIQLASLTINENSPFELLVLCTEPLINDQCHESISISCNDNIRGDLSRSLPESGVMPCSSDINIANGIWYNILGQGDTIGLSVTSTTFVPNIAVYQGICSELVCVENIEEFAIPRFFSFFANSDEVYKILISSSFVNSDLIFDLSTTCDTVSEEEFEVIPTLSDWSLINLCIVLMILGVVYIKESDRKNSVVS